MALDGVGWMRRNFNKIGQACGGAGARKRPGFVAELAAKLHHFLEALNGNKGLRRGGRVTVV